MTQVRGANIYLFLLPLRDDALLAACTTHSVYRHAHDLSCHELAFLSK